MNTKVNCPGRHPYLAAGLLLLATLAIFSASGATVAILKLPTMSLYVIAFVVLALMCAGLLILTSWWREVGYRAPYACCCQQILSASARYE
jgi:hypothetical protein